MRLFIFLSIVTLAATSGYTSPPHPVSRSLSQARPAQAATCPDVGAQSEQLFLTRNAAQPFILMDPNSDSDEDGMINLLDLHPEDPDHWIEFTPVEVSEDIDSPGPLDPRELDTSSSDHPLLL